MIRRQEPLTPEERELAAQLSRLGPHGEPAPALDSRIMAAAHAELAETNRRERKPRWPVALGLAASVLLAVGVAWQLRPLEEAPIASEVPTAAAAPEPAIQAPAEAPATGVAEQTADAAPLSPAPEAFPITQDPEIAAPASPRQLQKPAASDTAARAPAPVRKLARVPTPKSTTRETDRYSPPPPPAPPAPAEDARAGAPAESAPTLQASHDAERAAVQAEQAAQAKRARDEATSNRLLLRESEQRRRQESPPTAASAAAQDSIEETSSARATLRRTDLQLPVAEDAKLASAEWLDRIRLRRDLGDSGNASASLRMFVDAHPFQRVPEDLRPLLGEE
ncbi:hypothetical protein [Pseudoxanthomonas sp. UTMC 1351]|uniref:hypothetical protein n=1 Tax=Pseudoxanthomonas sp. UTMC 1351 TaxID=2695853 RepID=UPI0034CDFF3A